MEQDYIGLSEATPMEELDSNVNILCYSSSTLSTESSRSSGLKTELRLGLPGSESPERKLGSSKVLARSSNSNGFLSGSHKIFSSSGAKRVFSDAIDGYGRWVFSIHGGGTGTGTEVIDLCKDIGQKKTELIASLRGVLSSPIPIQDKIKPQLVSAFGENSTTSPAASKAQVVGWPPIRSFRRNTLMASSASSKDDDDKQQQQQQLFVKVSMDGAPYLRKVDLKTYKSYIELSSALGNMFSCFIVVGQGQGQGQGGGGRGIEELVSASLDHHLPQDCDYVVAYEDKDGDWMLVGDVPWKMFTNTCRRLRIMKGSDAIGLASSLISSYAVR
ncbi:hypothetical protein Dimus_027724 [Dionaea muscipula]